MIQYTVGHSERLQTNVAGGSCKYEPGKQHVMPLSLEIKVIKYILSMMDLGFGASQLSKTGRIIIHLLDIIHHQVFFY
jgi:hypothetical protein